MSVVELGHHVWRTAKISAVSVSVSSKKDLRAEEKRLQELLNTFCSADSGRCEFCGLIE